MSTTNQSTRSKAGTSSRGHLVNLIQRCLVGEASCIANVLILLHTIFLAHLEDAAVVHELVDECTLILKVVDVVILELIEKGQLPVKDRPLSKVIFPYLLGHLLVQYDDWQHMRGSWEMVARSINVNILEKDAQALCRPHLLLHLPLELLNLEALLLELAVDEEEVSEALREEVVSLLDLIRESLAMMAVKLKTSNDCLLRNVEERHDQSAFGSPHDSKAVAYALVF